MIGRTIVRWLAASGRPAALARREADERETSEAVSSNEKRFATNSGNWLTRTIQRNRVLTASGIAVMLFTFGGFAWSARPDTRLVRKPVSPIPDINDDFDELLNLPTYTRPSDTLSNVSTQSAPGPAYDPFASEPEAERQSDAGDYQMFDHVEPVDDFAAPPTLESGPPRLAAPTESPELEFPSLGLPDLPAPQLDHTADQTQQLFDSGNPFQSQ